MLLRFVVAPATMVVGSLVVGLRGDVLCIAIIQVSFTFTLLTSSEAMFGKLAAKLAGS